MGSSTGAPKTGPRQSPGLGYLVALIVAVAAVFSGVYYLYLSRPPQPPTNELVFSPVGIDAEGNASWVVDSVTGGPYPYSGFSMRLVVNGGSTDWFPLGPNDTVNHLVVGSVTYRVVWGDADGNASVSKGDRFVVTGDNTRLSSLSAFEFKLKWQESWIATARWSTD